MGGRHFVADPSPWMPITDVRSLRVLGKFVEELGEAVSAAARCIIQGVDGREPATGEVNRDWLTKEIADVLCNVDLVIEHFDLDQRVIGDRARFKRAHLLRWHQMKGE